MSEKQFRQAIEEMRHVEVDPASAARVAARIQHAVLLRRRPWKLWSLAAAALIAVVLWPRTDEPAGEPAVLAPPPDEEQPQEEEQVDETPIEEEQPSPEEQVDETEIEKVKADEAGLYFPKWGKRWFETSTPADAAAKKLNAKLAGPLAELRKLAGGRIVVRMGDFDDLSRVLRRYRIPHTVTVKLDPATLKKAGLVFLPCTRHPGEEVDFAPLATFVKKGGWLAASDWGVHWLERAAPKSIVAKKTKEAHADRFVEVLPGATSPLVAGVFREGDPTGWWFEEASQFVAVEAKTARTLVRARPRSAFGASADVVVDCPYGAGRVFFTRAHFDQKARGNKAPSVAAMDRLLLNLLIERFVRK